MRISLFLLWLQSILWISSASTSHRAKCALECFSRCMQSGSPSGVYCSCPVERTHRPCNSVELRLAKAPMVPSPSSFSSEYLDAHSIRLQIPPYPGAFAYIFEYATVSTKSDEWYFAGSSTTPMVTFTILDPCRDYKFRVIVVLRSADPIDHFLIYDQKSIPVRLPPFVLSPDQIFAEPFTFNETTDSLKIYVRWTLPRGYSDSDIYGYEAPALYPLQCRTPEDELPQPKIEIVKAGGRLIVSLPSTIVEARCRLWVEVRMLPRCVRLEPFRIQKNIEIDCDRNTDMEICKKEMNPVCMEVKEIVGKNGRATLTWLPPLQMPLYYHVRYGLAEMKGTPPFVTWQLATKKDLKVSSVVTNLTVDVTENQDFGVQVCAIFAEHRKRPKFGLARVTPFHCTSCNNTPTDAVGRCGECGMIEGTIVADKSLKDSAKRRHHGQMHNTKELPLKALPSRSQVVPSQTVFRMQADLLVGGNKRMHHQLTNMSAAQVNTHAADSPIAIERAEEINELASIKTVSPPSSTPTSTTTTFSTTTTTPLTTTLETTTVQETTVTTTSAIELTSEGVTVQKPEVDSTNDVKVPDVLEDVNYSKAEVYNMTSIEPTVEADHTLLDELDKDDEVLRNVHHSSEDEANTQRKELEESVNYFEKALDEAEEARKLHTNESSLELFPVSRASLKHDAVKKAASVLLTKLESSSAELRHHEKSKKCLLSIGIVCSFGCETSKTCRCPSATHLPSAEGGCVSRDSFGNVLCIPSTDVNATWDPISMNVMVWSNEASNHIRSVFGADRLFVEFGRINEQRSLLNGSWTSPVFNGSKRSRMVAVIEKLVRSGTFLTEPFVFHVNETMNVAGDSYGIRFCTFSSSRIKDPYKRDWNVDVIANVTGNMTQMAPISPVHFSYDVRSDSVLRPTRETFWNAFFVIGKIMMLFILVLIMFALVYLNCSRLKLLYDRKRTHHFRPYYIDPQVQVTSMHPYSSLSQKRTGTGGYYQTRSRAI